MVPNSVSKEMGNKWMKDLWDEIQKVKINHEGKGKAPMEELNLEKEQAPMEIASRYGLVGLSSMTFSKVSTFKKFPSFIGDFDTNDNVRRALN